MLTHFVDYYKVIRLAVEFKNKLLKTDIMKKLALVLAIAFTMGLAASSVSAATKDNAKKTEKKECCAKATECSKDKKACCSAKAEVKTESKAEKK